MKPGSLPLTLNASGSLPGVSCCRLRAVDHVPRRVPFHSRRWPSRLDLVAPPGPVRPPSRRPLIALLQLVLGASPFFAVELLASGARTFGASPWRLLLRIAVLLSLGSVYRRRVVRLCPRLRSRLGAPFTSNLFRVPGRRFLPPVPRSLSADRVPCASHLRSLLLWVFVLPAPSTLSPPHFSTSLPVVPCGCFLGALCRRSISNWCSCGGGGRVVLVSLVILLLCVSRCAGRCRSIASPAAFSRAVVDRFPDSLLRRSASTLFSLGGRVVVLPARRRDLSRFQGSDRRRVASPWPQSYGLPCCPGPRGGQLRG